MTDNVTEIVVMANRVYQSNLQEEFKDFLFNSWYNIPVPQQDKEWQYGPFTNNIEDYTNPNHLKKQLILTSISDFITYMEDLKSHLAILPSNTVVNIGSTFTMTIQQLIAKVESIKFRVFDKQFNAGYGGQNFGDRIDIDFRTLANYMSKDAVGFNYLIFHEIAHNSSLGLISRSWNWNSHLDNGGTGSTFIRGNPLFERQESQANTMARNIAESVGLSISSSLYPNHPPYGFTDLGL